MELSVTNLATRNGKFQFRYRLPVTFLSGKIREIRISLKTNDLKKAVTCCKLASEKIDTLIESGEYRDMDLKDLRRLAADYITERLEDHTRQMAAYGRVCPETKEEGKRIALNIMKHYENARDANDPSLTSAPITAKSLLRELPHDQTDISLLSHEVLLAEIFLARMQHDRIAGRSFLTEYNKSIYDEVMNGNYRTAEEIAETERVFTLGELTAKYVEEKSPEWGVYMRDSVPKVFSLFMHFIPAGNDIRSIRHHNLLDFRDRVLKKIPSRGSLHTELKKISLMELVSRPAAKTLSIATINGMLVKLGGFFIWCHNHEYIDRNPATNLQLSTNTKASEERLPYAPDDLKILFANLREDKLKAWAPLKYWIPLVALYSGARQNEICQLQTDNIIVAKEIPCFQITECEEDGMKVKTADSKRIIPIHPVLLELGFLTYMLNRRKDTKSKRLWPKLTNHPKQGYAYKFQKFFGNFNRRYVTDDPKKVFHSLRHNFTNNLKQQGVQESMVAELVGHSVHSMTFSRYGKAFNPEILLENLKKLDHGFDIFEVVGKTPLPQEVIDSQITQLPVLSK